MKRKARLGANRAALARMNRIHQLLQNKEYPNCAKVAEEFELTVRTIRRDVEFMKDRLDLPIAFDTARNGYFYTKPVPCFPDMPMNEAEVFALFVASKAIDQYRGTPFQRLLETAFRRLTSQLDESIRFSIGSLDQAISFRPFAPGDADIKTFEMLSKAVRERRPVTFRYRNRGEQNWQKRDVHPCHIAYGENTWYVYGFDVKRKAIRTFALMRLTQLELCPGKFEPVKFNLAEYLRDSFRVYKGREGDDYEVVIDFDAWAADEVRGHRCHESQELMELPKGILRLTFRLNNLEEVERWVMSFGTHATVVRPKALRDRLRKTGVELAARYGGDDSAA